MVRCGNQMNVPETQGHVSLFQQSEQLLESSFLQTAQKRDLPYVTIGMIPLFFADFSVDLQAERVLLAVGNFSLAGPSRFQNPVYRSAGLARREERFDYTVVFRPNGLLEASQQLPLLPRSEEQQFGPTLLDIFLRQFVESARRVYEACETRPPYVLGMRLGIPRPLTGVYPVPGGDGEEHTEPLPAGDYRFPFLQLDDLTNADRPMRPLCDQTHQMFGRPGSPNFSEEGRWVALKPLL